MNYKTIELQLLQLEESFSKSRSNIYSDIRKEEYFIELHELFLAIKKSNYAILDLPYLSTYKFLLDYIFTGLEYLDSSTLNVIPYEIISCLKYSLDDWIKKEHFIIVTSLSNRNSEFFLESNDTEETFENINNYIKDQFSAKLSRRLVKITLPKVLSRDYLSCVVLYHELGHFIDNELNISKKILYKKYGVTEPNTNEEITFYKHRMEYFADIFAAQYIVDASNLYLNHIAYGNKDSESHPATQSRIDVVEKFLDGESCNIVEEINEVLSSSGHSIMKKRYSSFDIKDSKFASLLPHDLKDEQELHYIFKHGWDLWLDSDNNFLKEFGSRQKYHVINNLIEKSISNYTLLEKWNAKSL